jgi:hypothetical protein
MRTLLVTGFIAVTATAVCIILILGYEPIQGIPEPSSIFILKELVKYLLAFVIVSFGGVVIRHPVDRVLQRQRSLRESAVREEETRRTIVKEFAEIYSGFYTIRKHYHSLRKKENKVYAELSASIPSILDDLLRRSVELEGRFGALKALSVIHFGLPTEKLTETKNIEDLLEKLKNATASRERARIQLDLIGEWYDDWRHALEKGESIFTEKDTDQRATFYDTYRDLLAFFEQGPEDQTN